MDKKITLFGRVFIEVDIRAVTGLHIGGSGADLEIGGLDKEVIRNPVTKEPYIPGSSLRGKMRSQTEKILGRPINSPLGIHVCGEKEMAMDVKGHKGCPVCHIFGIPAGNFPSVTRLVVRDSSMTPASREKLNNAKLDLSFSELKTEVAIDRVTSAATPRTMERVPAGAVFGPVELVFGVYEAADYDRLKVVVDALQLVEDDYLGGAGSRGSGKVCFEKIKIYARSGREYSKQEFFANTEKEPLTSIQDLANKFDELKKWVQANLPMEG